MLTIFQSLSTKEEISTCSCWILSSVSKRGLDLLNMFAKLIHALFYVCMMAWIHRSPCALLLLVVFVSNIAASSRKSIRGWHSRLKWNNTIGQNKIQGQLRHNSRKGLIRKSAKEWWEMLRTMNKIFNRMVWRCKWEWRGDERPF